MNSKKIFRLGRPPSAKADKRAQVCIKYPPSEGRVVREAIAAAGQTNVGFISAALDELSAHFDANPVPPVKPERGRQVSFTGLLTRKERERALRHMKARGIRTLAEYTKLAVETKIAAGKKS